MYSAGTSLQNMIHYAQMVQSAELQKYDFRNDEINTNRYLSPTPPKIDLSSIRTPLIVYYGTEDDLSTVDDVEWTLGKWEMIDSIRNINYSEQLPNVVDKVKLEGFDHLDFLWGTRAPTYLYAEIIDFITEASANFQT